MSLLESILTAAGDIEHRTMHRPATVRVHPATAYQLEQEMWSRVMTPHTFTMPGITERTGPAGMRLDLDEHLPAGAWRLCGADDTLLYDSREGTHAL